MIIFLAWSGCISGLCAVQASATGMWEYADVAVHASLCIKLSSATDDFCLRKNKKKKSGKNMMVVVVAVEAVVVVVVRS